MLLGVNKILSYIKLPNYNFRMKIWRMHYKHKLKGFLHKNEIKSIVYSKYRHQYYIMFALKYRKKRYRKNEEQISYKL